MGLGGVLDHHRARLRATGDVLVERLSPADAERAPDLLRDLGAALEATNRERA